MTRTLFKGGRVFDGTGAPLAEADVVVEAGRILEVGAGLDGDEAVDVSGLAVLPGMFDCHGHVVVSTIDLLVDLQQPSATSSSPPPAIWSARSTVASPPCVTPAAPTSASSRRSRTAWSPGRACGSPSRCSARPAGTPTAGCRAGSG